jgi:hypothetical protein
MATADDDTWLQHVVAIQSGTDERLVNDAVRALQPMIEKAASRVCFRRGVRPQVRVDFVESALTAIITARDTKERKLPPRIQKYDAEAGPFPRWLWKTLDHLLLDELRSLENRRKHETAATDIGHQLGMIERQPELRKTDVDDAIDRTTPFGNRDIQEIEAWRIRDRLRLLAFEGLWPKVPQDLWARWCVEEGLSEPFPQGLEEALTKQDRFATLAGEMGESPEALKQHWHRKRKLLRNLSYVRELRHDA